MFTRNVGERNQILSPRDRLILTLEPSSRVAPVCGRAVKLPCESIFVTPRLHMARSAPGHLPTARVRHINGMRTPSYPSSPYLTSNLCSGSDRFRLPKILVRAIARSCTCKADACSPDQAHNRIDCFMLIFTYVWAQCCANLVLTWGWRTAPRRVPYCLYRGKPFGSRTIGTGLTGTN